MGYIKHHVKLDFSKRNIRPTIVISNGDTNSHKIIFSFCNGSEPIDITKATVCGVSINGIENNNVEINVVENTVEYIPSLDISYKGITPCVLTLADARGRVLFAPVFYILVDDVFSEKIKENFCNDLKNNNAWGIIAKVIEYAQIAYTKGEDAAEAKEAAAEAKEAAESTDEAIECVMNYYKSAAEKILELQEHYIQGASI